MARPGAERGRLPSTRREIADGLANEEPQSWPAYEASLRQRGDVTVWFEEGAIQAWNAEPSAKLGGQQRYSDLAIVTTLTLRTVFHLAPRQAEGFVASLLRLMAVDLDTPDHTTLSRRGANRMTALGAPVSVAVVPWPAPAGAGSGPPSSHATTPCGGRGISFRESSMGRRSRVGKGSHIPPFTPADT